MTRVRMQNRTGIRPGSGEARGRHGGVDGHDDRHRVLLLWRSRPRHHGTSRSALVGPAGQLTEEPSSTGWVTTELTSSKMPGAFWKAPLGLSDSVEPSMVSVPPSASTTKKMAPPPSRAVLSLIDEPSTSRL